MISTHILDTSTGSPAAGVSVTLEQKSGTEWKALFSEKTNSDGRIRFECPRETGAYRLTFGIESYIKDRGLKPFFLDVPIAFDITDTQRNYHIPLLLSPYGLSTYRGS
jgi:5-hydroxyisourate hydrolase